MAVVCGEELGTTFHLKGWKMAGAQDRVRREDSRSTISALLLSPAEVAGADQPEHFKIALVYSIWTVGAGGPQYQMLWRPWGHQLSRGQPQEAAAEGIIVCRGLHNT